MFRSKTPPISYVGPGYQVDLDKYQTPTAPSCRRVAAALVFGLIAIVIMCGGITLAVTSASSQIPPQTPAPADIITTAVSDLAAVATATATLDYCWWLTPTLQPTSTLIPVTPDAWALQGTSIALQTGTPTPTPTATTAPPRAWCDNVTPTNIPAAIVTLPLPSSAPSLTPLPQIIIPTERPAPVQQRATDMTWAIPPMPILPTSAPLPVFPTQPPMIVTVIVVQTQPPPTLTSTPTSTSTATPTPTSTPTVSIVGSCIGGVAAWHVIMSPLPTDWTQWIIRQGDMMLAADTWPVGVVMPLTASLTVPGDGMYTLDILQWWSGDEIVSADVLCFTPPTMTPTATVSAEPLPVVTDDPAATPTSEPAP